MTDRPAPPEPEISETRAERLAAWGYSAGWRAVRALPRSVALRGAYLAADEAFRRRGPRVLQYARNLRRVLDHADAGDGAGPVEPAARLARETKLGLRSYARFWVETFQLPGMDPAAVVEKVRPTTYGMEHVQAAVDAGRGVVVALPHSGNWDVAGLFVTRDLVPITTVAERLKPESLYREFLAYRESLGMEILPLTGPGSANSSAVLKQRLRAGGVVCLVGDRDLTSSGVPVTFFGEATRMPAGPAMLAALTGADLCPVHLTFLPDGWKQVVRPPLPLPGTRLSQQVRAGTQLLADAFAAGIAETPHDWHMLQPLWLDDLARTGSGRPEKTAPIPAETSDRPVTVAGAP